MSTWRGLPAPVPPARHETLASWLHRLAAVHGLNTGDLRAYLGIGRAAPEGGMPGLAGRLAAVTGYPAGNLALALPELRVPEPGWLSLRHLAQRACPRCTARHQGGPVRRLFAHHEYLCTRHGYWTGPPDPSRDDPPRPLAAQVPELAAAQRTLGRTRRLHGWAATFDATAAATSICIELRIRTVHQPLWTRWERRLDLLMPGDWRRSLFMAAIFPEVAALAAILAAPPGDGQPAQRRTARPRLRRTAEPPRHQRRPVDLGHRPRSRAVPAARLGILPRRPPPRWHAAHHRGPPHSRAADRHPLPPRPARTIHPQPRTANALRLQAYGGPTSARSDSIVSVQLSGTVVVTPRPAGHGE